MSKNNEVGSRIRNIRKNIKGLSMEAFGELFDPKASKGVVSNWENNYNLPNNKRLKQIAEIGGISVDELLYGNEKNYFYSAIPNDDLDYLDLAYKAYASIYGENSYQDEQTILSFYNTFRSEVEDRTSKITLVVSLYTAKILNDYSQERLKDEDTPEAALLQNLTELELNQAIDNLEQSFEFTEKEKEMIIEQIKKNIDYYNDKEMLNIDWKNDAVIKLFDE